MAIEDLYAKACDAVERPNYGYAIQLFRQVLRENPEYPDARIALRGTERRRVQEQGRSVGDMLATPVAALLTALKAAVSKARKRLEVYEDYLEKNPNSFWALRGAATAAAKAGLTGEAIQIYKDALKLKPSHKQALRAVGNLLIQAGQHQDALRYLSHLSQMEPKNRDLQREVRDLSATQHMASHDMEGAESFRDLIRDKGMAEKLEASGRMAVTMDDLRAKVVEAEQELAEHPDSVPRILGLAQMYMDTREVKKARALLREKHQAIPDNYELREKLGDVQLATYDAALARLAKQLEEKPDDEAAKQKLEALRKQRSDFAVKEFEWRLSQHPTDKHLNLMLGCAYAESGDQNKAIAALQIAAQDARYEVQSCRMLGVAFMAKEQYDLALEQFERALARHKEMDDAGKDLRYCQAQAYERMGDREEALKVFKHIYSQDINFRDVAQKVEGLSG